MKRWLPIAALSLPGCALLSKSEAIQPHYFSAEAAPSAELASPAFPASGSAARGQRLRLGHVGAPSSLRERISYRNQDGELGLYEDERWTERPASYLRRALSRELFERRGFSRAVSGAAPTLEAELVAFEEVRGLQPHARLTVAFTLDDGRDTLLEHTLTVRARLPSRGSGARGLLVARALTRALQEAVQRIAGRVSAALASPNSVQQPCATATGALVGGPAQPRAP